MKRRSFVQKSVASAIVAATPMALTGLVRADGIWGSSFTGTGSESTWFSNDATDELFEDGLEDASEPDDIEIPPYEPEIPPTYDPENDLGEEGARPKDSSCPLVDWFKTLKQGKWVCWREVTGCGEGKTVSWMEPCPQNNLAVVPITFEGWCNSLQVKDLPPLCVNLA